MPFLQLDIKMLPMKVHFFLFMGGVAPMTSFLPTIAKQLGYSTFVFGTVYSTLLILSLIIKPIVGAIVDQFRVKKTIFLTLILLSGLTAFSIIFVPQIPFETTTELRCSSSIFLNVCPEALQNKQSKCRGQRVMDDKSEHIVGCELKCKNNDKFRKEICKSLKLDDHCSMLTISNSFNALDSTANKDFQKMNIKLNNNFYDADYVNLLALIQMNRTDHINNCFYFRITSTKFLFNNSKSVDHTPFCSNDVKSHCQVQCSSTTIMDLITPQTYKDSVWSLKPFWIFFLIVSLFWISQAAVYSLSDSICFDQLGNSPNLYGRQRCWGSIGWGIFSIFSGWIVDIFSSSEVIKNYLPIYYICLLVLLFNFFAASKLTVSETKISTNICKDLGKLLMEVKVLGFLMWTIAIGICTAMIWNLLFWYLEDVTSIYECNAQGWIKTLQGFVMGVQCFGGEVPFFFWSGWIIKRLGHLNCMSLVLGVFAIRFYAYSLLTNPVWVLAIELTNGITFGLAYALLMSYARIIALPGTESTMVGLVGGVFEGVGVSLGSLLGGYLYEIYGGVLTFRIFAYGSALACLIHLFCQHFLKSNGKLGFPSFVNGSTEYASPNEAIHMLSDN